MILMPPGKLWISVIASTLDKAEVYILSYSMWKTVYIIFKRFEDGIFNGKNACLISRLKSEEYW